MDDFWGTAVPNWITAGSTFLALAAAIAGATIAWRALRTEQEHFREERRLQRATRARSVTAHWIVRHRDGTGRGGSPKEWGLLVVNHNPTPVYGVEIDATVRGGAMTIEPIDPLVDRLFVRRDLAGDSVTWAVRMHGTDVVKEEPITDRRWQLHGLRFVLDGELLEWSATPLDGDGIVQT